MAKEDKHGILEAVSRDSIGSIHEWNYSNRQWVCVSIMYVRTTHTCIRARIYNTCITTEKSFVESIVNNRIDSNHCFILYAGFKNEITSVYIPFDQSCGVKYRLIRSIPWPAYIRLYMYLRNASYNNNTLQPKCMYMLCDILAWGVRAEDVKRTLRSTFRKKKILA